MAGQSQNMKRRVTRAVSKTRQSGSLGAVIIGHPVAVSAVCALVAGLFVVAYVAQVNGQAAEARADMLARYGGEQVEVCVATRDIAAGEVVDASVMTTRLWVADLLPQGALRSASEVLGRTTTSTVLAGEVLCEGRFVDLSQSYEVPFGLCAVSVPAKDVQAVGGAISPGMYIDMYATGSSATTLIGSEVLVLATSKQPGGELSLATSASTQQVQWITLALAPEAVEETVAAAQNLSLYFTLPGEGVGQLRASAEETEYVAPEESEDLPKDSLVSDGTEQEVA